MKNLLIVLLMLPLIGFSQVRMNLPKDFIQESSEDKYSIINASKYDSEGYIQATIEVKYSDDRSFSMFTNEDYINEMLDSNKMESTAGMMFDDFEFHIKEKLFLIGIGDCVSSIYSGAYKSNGIRITNLVIQFVKNNKLYTLIGSSFPENFSENHKDFLKSFDTLKL